MSTKRHLVLDPQVVKKILSVLIHLMYRCSPACGLGFAEALAELWCCFCIDATGPVLSIVSLNVQVSVYARVWAFMHRYARVRIYSC